MTDAEVKVILRAQGMCGHILVDRHACILPIGHDGGEHERGWKTTKHVYPDPHAHDSRVSITRYVVSDGTRTFTADHEVDAQWLASTLTRLDL
jgi:hypothetical protein